MTTLVVTQAAIALVFDTVFVAEGGDELCGPATGGRRIVNRQRLPALIDDAAVPVTLLDRANPTGRTDANVSREELLYAITAKEPFGPAPMPELGDRVDIPRSARTRFVASWASSSSGRSE
jgi:hypothetical protein